jgi:hypothetical protein
VVTPATKNYFDPNTKEFVVGALKVLPEATYSGVCYVRNLKWTAEEAAAADADAIHAAVTLGAAAASVTTEFTDPPCPRNVSMTPSANMGTAKKVKVYGLNADKEEITEELTFASAGAVLGAKAFASVTKIDLPIQEHAPAAQVETATAAGTVTTAGNAAVVVKSALFGEDETIDVPVALNDDAAAIALAIRTALAANAVVAEHFTVGGADAAIILTAKVAAANDDTLNIAIDDGTGDGASEGVTTAATSTNTTPGVPPDTLTIGWGDKLGLGMKMAGAHHLATKLGTSAEANAPAFATSATAIDGNTIDLNTALDGSAVETLFIQL